MLFLTTVLLSLVIVFSEERCLLQRRAIRAAGAGEWATVSQANLYCKDSTDSFVGFSTGWDDCKIKCSSDPSCRFYSFWKSNFCRLTAYCEYKEADGNEEIWIVSKPAAGVEVHDMETKPDWTGTRWDRNGQNCSPKCSYKCKQDWEQPSCTQDCEPVCKEPKCTTDCETMDLEWLKQCKTVCGQPNCQVVCEGCPDGTCPWCKTECTPPTCKTECPENVCQAKCDRPECEWKCVAPGNCPPPDCEFWCETPEKCVQPTFSLAQIDHQISLKQTSVSYNVTESKATSSKMSLLHFPETARVPIRVRTVFEAWSQPVMKGQ